MKPTIKYGLLFTTLFLIEVFIALYVHDSFVRPFIGDVLVVMLLYYFIMFCFALARREISKARVSLGVLIFAFVVEFAQLANILEILSLQTYKIARIVLGTSFDWRDLLAYICGYLIIRLTDR